MSTLEDLVKQLPPDLRQEVEDFARYLVEKHVPAQRRPMRFTWVGALQDLGKRVTSVELQHEIMAMRGRR